MHTLGKVVILLLAVGAFLFQGCRKDEISNTDRIKGVWRMEASFWDKDSNGLDSGDEVYEVKPSDTILWNFIQNGDVEYYINNRKSHTGTWAVSYFNSLDQNYLLIDGDLNFHNYLYKINILNSNTCVIYAKKTIIFFSSVYTKWEGYVLVKY